jgi:hypothetical protein
MSTILYVALLAAFACFVFLGLGRIAYWHAIGRHDGVPAPSVAKLFGAAWYAFLGGWMYGAIEAARS